MGDEGVESYQYVHFKSSTEVFDKNFKLFSDRKECPYPEEGYL